MKKIEHKTFLKNNSLDKKLLLEPIQDKIEIFDRMYKLLDTVSDCEKGDLLEQLEELDLEILVAISERPCHGFRSNCATDRAIAIIVKN